MFVWKNQENVGLDKKKWLIITKQEIINILENHPLALDNGQFTKISEIINKYHGMSEYYEESGKFAVNIMLLNGIKWNTDVSV